MLEEGAKADDVKKEEKGAKQDEAAEEEEAVSNEEAVGVEKTTGDGQIEGAEPNVNGIPGWGVASPLQPALARLRATIEVPSFSSQSFRACCNV
jgi:hypothetical protein